ncbi:MAG: baseplate multidomain protein megatron, partial [Primorskyibacter sp.]
CAVAGGVESFCIGSELRGLTQIRDAHGFPTVRALRDLAAEVRKLLGPDVRIGYAADWSEYFGYHPDDGSGDVYFHLDPLWADETIDFIGIDNYVPLSDWRDGPGHADAAWGRCDNPGYLEANIEGGEGYAWFYATPEDRDAQIRTPITDGAYNEPWVYRCKDLRNWWRHPHHERIAGVRAAQPTAWVPQSKPIWFTELGCAAVDKGPNAPNLFWDPKSSESCLPPYSTGRRDDAVQRAYLKAMHRYWARENQSSDVYDGPMVDLSRAFVWAWDARPYPWFPNAAHVWTDGGNYQRGHWITGRLGAMTLGDVIKDLCSHADGGVNIPVDTDALSGVVRGYAIENTHDVRSAMQPLLMAYGVDATEDAGGVSFRQRGPDYTLPGGAVPVAADAVVAGDTAKGPVVQERAPDAELPDRVRVRFVEADGAHVSVVEEAALPGARDHGAEGSDTALVLTRSEGRQMAERWLHEAHIARDTLRFSLPPKWLGLRAGDVLDLEIDSTPERVRVDRIDIGADLAIEAVRVSDTVYVPADLPDEAVRLPKLVPATPVLPLMMDLPVMRGDEDPTLPHIAVAGQPWPGTVALYGSAFDAGYGLDLVLDRPSVVGVTQTVLPAGPVGLPDRGA